MGPKNIQPEIPRTPQPQVLNCGVGFLLAYGMLVHNDSIRVVSKNAGRLLKKEHPRLTPWEQRLACVFESWHYVVDPAYLYL